jgi:O-methyltransferase
MERARPDLRAVVIRGRALAGRFVSKQAASLLAHRARGESSRVGMGDLDASVLSIMDAARPYSVSSPERLAALCLSVDYVVQHDLPGAFVECGLWRGGSLYAVALRLHHLGVTDRELVGFDTFAGMTEPTEHDVDYRGAAAAHPPAVEALLHVATRVFASHAQGQPGTSREEVLALLTSSGYDAARIRLVEGPVEETLPEHAPDAVALLRLDTDWYESTRHELEHLYPRLTPGGVLLVDDYGHYRGARKAVDEYFDGHRILLQRIDYTGRLAVKQDQIGPHIPPTGARV